jgi:hypothetical protein
MNNFDDVLGHLLARCDETDVKKVLTSYDHSKNKPANTNHLGSASFTKPMLEATIEVLRTYSNEFYPHATTLIRSKMIARNKPQVAEDIVAVLYSITPTQCRTCKVMYVSTSAENTDANITCLLCGRRSHKECYSQYTIDNDAGVVFLCDPCLSQSETALILDTDNSLQPNVDPKKQGSTPKPEDEETVEADEAKIVQADEDKSKQPELNYSDDDICPLYKENSCPHGLTGKRHIEGKPCPKKHPPKCHYYIGRYGTSGCRYSAKRCPYYHPPLCENSSKLKICLNKQCTKYHITGTKRNLREPQKYQNRDQQSHDDRSGLLNRTPTPPQMWNSQSPQILPTQETHDNGGHDSFLTYLHHIKADMQNQMKQQLEMHQRMKADIEKSVKDILRDSILQKPLTEQKLPLSQPAFENLQNAPNQTATTNIQNPYSQLAPNIQAYHKMFPLPMMIPAK